MSYKATAAVNNIATGNITTPVVEVRDENDAPVEGADVVFHLPTTGPGGIFGDQKFVFTTKTNSQGQARCARFKPGSQVGRFEITVAVSSAGRTGHVVVHQSNSETDFAVEAQHTSTLKRKKWWLIGAGLTGGAVAASSSQLTVGRRPQRRRHTRSRRAQSVSVRRIKGLIGIPSMHKALIVLFFCVYSSAGL